MARIATLASLKKDEEAKVGGQTLFAGGGGRGGS